MKKAIRIAVAAVLIFTVIATSLFVILNSHHDHNEIHCQTCLRMEAAIGILKNILSSAALLLCLSFILLTVKARAVIREAQPHYGSNPIVLKVKLNN